MQIDKSWKLPSNFAVNGLSVTFTLEYDISLIFDAEIKRLSYAHSKLFQLFVCHGNFYPLRANEYPYQKRASCFCLTSDAVSGALCGGYSVGLPVRMDENCGARYLFPVLSLNVIIEILARCMEGRIDKTDKLVSCLPYSEHISELSSEIFDKQLKRKREHVECEVVYIAK